MRMLVLACLMLFALPAAAERVVAGLSRDMISITANFAGSEIVIFGAVSRDAPAPLGDPLEVIITVEGPSGPIEVRRKERRLGVWMNVETAEVDEAPSFYAVSTTGPLIEVLSQTEDLRHEVSIPRAIRAVGTGVGDQEAFVSALIRIREEEDLYQLNEESVILREETLFNTAVQLPANLIEGDYRTRIFLTRGGRVLDVYEQVIEVRKVGLERLIFNLSQEFPLLYGVISLIIAIAAGWLASAAFRYVRN